MRWPKLLAIIVICQLAGVVGSIFTRAAIPTWYYYLKKPSFTPPNWLFGPTWITLYLLMAVAAYLIWQKGWQTQGVRQALTIFLIQLLLNTFWSLAFFGWRSPATGLIVIILLWLSILATIIVFAKISHPAAWLLLPYILWVSLATALNAAIYFLNR